MFIDTRAMEFALTDAIVSHVEARVEQALGAMARWVLRVTVRLEDVNADRGGVDKRCSIVVAIRRRGVIVVEGTDENLYVAVDKAASRARRTAMRTVSRHLARERRDPQRPGALIHT